MKITQAITMPNVQKAIRYLKNNGTREAFYASLERISKQKEEYFPECLSQKELELQKKEHFQFPQFFSILVPAYETKPEYLKALLLSLENQTYQHFELILADASESGDVAKQIQEYIQNFKNENNDFYQKINYYKLENNLGISENTNQALQFAQGTYIGLLDHDDLLTPDALFEMQRAIEEKMVLGYAPLMLYSDEDKCDGEGNVFFEPHIKEKFNFDLILSNNYICHFLVMEANVMKTLKFRKKYDGAQDYDLVLRCIAYILNENAIDVSDNEDGKRSGIDFTTVFNNKITHVTKTLYHWRCHTGSTAENPQSKRYAYEAGLRAVEDFLHSGGILGSVKHLKHLGFYRINYPVSLFEQRSEVGAIGGKLIKRNRIIGGAMDAKGNVLYQNLNRHFSGYMNKAVLYQNVEAVDARCMEVREELLPVYKTFFPENIQESDICQASLAFCREVNNLGYLIVWDPQWEKK